MNEYTNILKDLIVHKGAKCHRHNVSICNSCPINYVCSMWYRNAIVLSEIHELRYKKALQLIDPDVLLEILL